MSAARGFEKSVSVSAAERAARLEELMARGGRWARSNVSGLTGSVSTAASRQRDMAELARRARMRDRLESAGAAGLAPRMRPLGCDGNRYPLVVDGALRATCECHWMQS